MLLILALLAQAGPSIDDHVAAFIKGDDAARSELVKLGAYAILPLRKARDGAPEKIDALVLDLKKAAAHPKGCATVQELDRRTQITVVDADVISLFNNHLRKLARQLFVDRIDPTLLKSAKFTLRHEKASVGAILDDFCRQTGLDFGIFHDTLVIGHPDRLWSAPPPAPMKPLEGEALERAKRLVDRLDDESMEVREAATKELLELGTAVLPLVESQRTRAEPEIAGRCARIYDRLTRRPRAAFGPTVAERAHRTADDDKSIARLRGQHISMSFHRLPVSSIAHHFQSVTGVEMETSPEAGVIQMSFHANNMSVFDVLALIAQSNDLEVTMRDGRLRMESRESAERLLAPAK